MRDKTVICSAASKAYAMTGWRCGWAIGPKDMIAQCNVVQGHSTSNINSITQKAAIAALTGPQDGVTDDAERVPQAPRCGARLADRRSALRVREARRRVLPVPVRRRFAVADRHPQQR